MRILLTGATGFIGSHLVPELIGAGHEVVGLTRSDAGVNALVQAGAEPCRGDVNDTALLRKAADSADGVIHAAFQHDFANLKRHSENDRVVIQTLGAALAGSSRPLIVTSGTGLVRPQPGQPARETDPHAGSANAPRAATEEAAEELIANGARLIVMRLPQVHDRQHQGRVAVHIRLARQKGFVAIIGEGANCLPAAHVSDVVRLYRLALEHGEAGAHYHAVSEEGVATRDIAQAIGEGLKLPVRSISQHEAADYFGPLADLAAMDLSACGALTRQWFDWHPAGPDLLTDLRNMDYSA